jgi:hypothetical protein
MVLEHAFDELMEQVRCDQFVDVRAREVMGEWLKRDDSIVFKTLLS